jgi:sulfatase maturation enzyme AslB (radical SAM superfamily)
MSKIANTHMAVPFISLRVTEMCNFRCKYCINDFQEQSMTFETAKAAIEEIQKYFTTLGIETFDILFNGGEPLLEADLIYNVMDMLPKGCNGKLLTNGTQVNGLKKLLPFKDRMVITISLDGDDETQLINRDSIVTKEFIEVAKQFSTVAFSRTLAPNNIHRHREGYEYLKSLSEYGFIVHTLCMNAIWTEENKKDLRDCLEDIFINDCKYLPRTVPFLFTKSKSGEFVKDKDSTSCCNRSFTVLVDGTFSKCLIDYRLHSKSFDFINSSRCEIPLSSYCKDCDAKRLCSYCSMSFALDDNSFMIDASKYIKDDIENKQTPILCFYTNIIKELLAKYGDDLLWNTYSYYKNPKLLDVLLREAK